MNFFSKIFAKCTLLILLSFFCFGHLGAMQMSKGEPWTIEADAKLMRMIKKYEDRNLSKDWNYIAGRLGRTEDACIERAKDLARGILRGPLTEDDKKLIEKWLIEHKKSWGSYGYWEELARELKRSKSQVRWYGYSFQKKYENTKINNHRKEKRKRLSEERTKNINSFDEKVKKEKEYDFCKKKKFRDEDSSDDSEENSDDRAGIQVWPVKREF